MPSIPESAGLRQIIVKPDVWSVPVQTGGQQPCHGTGWRVTANPNAAGLILPLMEKYLLSEHELPWEFVERVADVACESLTNAGQHSRPETDIQASCFVVGTGPERRCTVQVFNYTRPDAPAFPKKEDIPDPDLNYDREQLRGRGLPLMKARTDHFVLEDLPGHAKQVTLGFDLTSKLH